MSKKAVFSIVALVSLLVIGVGWFGKEYLFGRSQQKTRMLEKFEQNPNSVLKKYSNFPDFDGKDEMAVDPLNPEEREYPLVKTTHFVGDNYKLISYQDSEYGCSPLDVVKMHPDTPHTASASIDMEFFVRHYCVYYLEQNKLFEPAKLYPVNINTLGHLIRPESNDEWEDLGLIANRLEVQEAGRPIYFEENYMFHNLENPSKNKDEWLAFGCSEFKAFDMQTTYAPDSIEYYAHGGNFSLNTIDKTTIDYAEGEYTLEKENILTCDTGIVC